MDLSTLSDEQLTAMLHQAVMQPKGPEAQSEFKPLTGAAETVTSLGTGAVATPLGGLAGLAGAALPGPKGQGARWSENVQNALTYQPKTETGKSMTEAISYPFQKLAEGADWAGGKSAEATGSPAVGTAVNTAIQALPMIAGKVASKFGSADSSAAALARQLKNSQTDAALVQAQEAGLRVPPTQANPSLVNQLLEGVGGKIKTSQRLSEQNQPVLKTLAKAAIDLPEETPLNLESLAAVRQQAGQSYEAVKGIGRITTDEKYGTSLDNISASTRSAAKDFPALQKDDVLKLVKGLKVDSFDASSAVDQIRALRADADKAYRTGDNELGKAAKSAASALEAQIERHLQREVPAVREEGTVRQTTPQGTPDLLENFRNARETIAKTYSIQKALKNDGNIDAKVLARELEKGKPLSGELKTIAQFGANFPKAAQLPEKVGGVPFSMLDAGVGGIASTVMQNPAYLAAILGRPAIRSLITSKPYQKLMTGPQAYGPSTMSRLNDIQANPATQMIEMSAGQRKLKELAAALKD